MFSSFLNLRILYGYQGAESALSSGDDSVHDDNSIDSSILEPCTSYTSSVFESACSSPGVISKISSLGDISGIPSPVNVSPEVLDVILISFHRSPTLKFFR